MNLKKSRFVPFIILLGISSTGGPTNVGWRACSMCVFCCAQAFCRQTFTIPYCKPRPPPRSPVNVLNKTSCNLSSLAISIVLYLVTSNGIIRNPDPLTYQISKILKNITLVN